MIMVRFFNVDSDFCRAGRFLVRHYQPDNQDGNWMQPAWEYMHSHPLLDESSLSRIGVWEDEGEIVAIVHHEWALGEAFLQVHPNFDHLKPDMLSHAERELYSTNDEGKGYLRVFVNDFDTDLTSFVQRQGYTRTEKHDRPVSKYVIPEPFPTVALPDGFRLKTLQEDNDLPKIHRVLWRGFDHPGEPDEHGIVDRKKMQSVPAYRKDLNVVVEAADGYFVAYSGTWFDADNRIAYVEPVATDPDYRRRGLGRAAVLEGIRRCAEMGATVAYVGSDQPFYLAIGFTRLFTNQCWTKILDAGTGNTEVPEETVTL